MCKGCGVREGSIQCESVDPLILCALLEACHTKEPEARLKRSRKGFDALLATIQLKRTPHELET